MADKTNVNQVPYRSVTLIDDDLLARIDAEVERRGFGTTRSDIVRDALRRLLPGAQPDRDSSVRAVG